MSTYFVLINTLLWILLATTGEAVAFSREAAILRRLASGSSLRLKPILASGQSSCSKANPCGIQISGYDTYQGIPTKTIDLKAGESWSASSADKFENVLYFKEIDRDIAGGKTVGFVAYFFTGYYDDALHFVWYDTKGKVVERSKVIGIYDVIGLAEERLVARSSYWTTSYTPVVNYRYLLPAVANDAGDGDDSGDTDATSSSKSLLKVVPMLASGQKSCSKKNPCGIEISGYDTYQGIPTDTIELKAGEPWAIYSQNVLYFKEIDPDIAGGKTTGFVQYFFIGYYENALHFGWSRKRYEVDAERVEEAVERSKVLSSEDLIALCEEWNVAYSSYYHGVGMSAQLLWKIIKPLTSN